MRTKEASLLYRRRPPPLSGATRTAQALGAVCRVCHVRVYLHQRLSIAATMLAPDIYENCPTENMLVVLPGSKMPLSMFFMRPSESSNCPELPFLVPPPPDATSLSSAGLSPRVLSASDVCNPAHNASSASLHHHLRSAASSSAVACDSAAERTALLRAAEEAMIACDDGFRLVMPHLLPAAVCDLSRFQPADWRAAAEEAMAADSSLFDALSAWQLRQVAEAARSETLCDLLVQTSFPRLLLLRSTEEREEQREQQEEGQQQQQQQADDADDDSAPLPGALSALLLVLLRGGTFIRAPAADFERIVVQPLRSLEKEEEGQNTWGRLGARAAAQATTMYRVLRANNARAPDM